MNHIVLLAGALLSAPAIAAAQATQFTVAPATSVAWWQVDPNYGHLWATTCPDDPSWQAGEARQGSSPINAATRKKTKLTDYSDKRVPLYPRLAVTPVCRPAVSGTVSVDNTDGWKGVHGEIRVNPDSLFTGLEMRDKYARKAVLETPRFRVIKFTIDSLTNVLIGAGDTITAVAVGKFEVHGVAQPMSAPVKAWKEGEDLRVQTHFSFPADHLVDVYDMSKLALGMGVLMGRWRVMHMGVDVILTKT